MHSYKTLVLVLAMAHLSPEAEQRLRTTATKEWPVYGGVMPDGFMLYAHDEDVGGVIEEFAPELWRCPSFARQQGFDYVLFDWDASPTTQLPTFEGT